MFPANRASECNKHRPSNSKPPPISCGHAPVDPKSPGTFPVEPALGTQYRDRVRLTPLRHDIYHKQIDEQKTTCLQN